MQSRVQIRRENHRQEGEQASADPTMCSVVTLPAYSPELNPIEGLWDQIKGRLGNRVFDTLAELEPVAQTES